MFLSAIVRKNYSTVPLRDRENGNFYFISRDRK